MASTIHVIAQCADDCDMWWRHCLLAFTSEICLKERRTIFQKDEQRKGEARARCFKLLLSLLIDMVFVSALGE